MNVLLLGSGGREHALAWKLAQSPLLNNLLIAPGNVGTTACGENVNLSPTDFGAVKQLVLDREVNLVIVGPEAPLVEGIHDFFLADDALKGIPVIGPAKLGATLEGSKEFSKEFMARHQVPTAAYQSFTKEQLDAGLDYLDTIEGPYVLKADGLAAGKGVVILEDREAAKTELRAMLAEAKFGAASEKVVIEAFLDGIELSVFVLTDGKDYLILPEAKDYKRIGEGDTGLNTGGMGAISPVPFADSAFLSKVEERIVKPTIDGLRKDNIDYKGFLFIGLMKVGDDPFVVEYNVRMGDPETEVVMPRVKSDLLEAFVALSEGRLGDYQLEVDPRAAVTVMMVSGGYPGSYEKGKVISGLENVDQSVLFHAGTKAHEGQVVTNGGRVIAVTSYGEDFRSALEQSYASLGHMSFDKHYYRTDIGFDL